MSDTSFVDSTNKSFSIMKHSPNSYLLIVGDYLVKGEFPNTAYSVYNGKASLSDFAQAFTVEELEKMLEYRKNQLGVVP